MPKTYKNKACKMCGKTFTPLSPNGKWCEECRPKARAEWDRAYRETNRKDEFEDNALHTCDSLDRVAKCLSCTRPNCNGWCDAVMDDSKKAKKEAHEKAVNETIAKVAHFVRAGARVEFIMRELGLTKNQFTRYKNNAIAEGLLQG